MATAYAALLGHLYHAESLYGSASQAGIALNTAVALHLLGFAVLWQNRRFGLVRLLTSQSMGGRAARHLVPWVVLIPTLIGWARVIGQDIQLYDTGLGTAISTFILVALMLAMVFYFSAAVHRTDTKRRAAVSELAEKERSYRELFDYSQGLICVHDLDGRLSNVNRAALLLLKYDAEEMIGRRLTDFMHEEHLSVFDAYMRQVTYEGLADGLLQLRARDGRDVILRYHNVLAMEAGKEPYVLGHAQDVTELIHTQQELRNLSLTDDLTGLYNRRGFLTLSGQQLKLERHARTALGLTLLFADMDGLKAINDRYGHEAGSDAIKALAAILRGSVRDADLVARWGGDEFVVLSIGSERDNARLMVERIERRIEEFNSGSSLPYLIGCSIGVAPIDLDLSTDIEETIAGADKAMYEVKRQRKMERGHLPRAASANALIAARPH